jgi:hypothetical protein
MLVDGTLMATAVDLAGGRPLMLWDYSGAGADDSCASRGDCDLLNDGVDVTAGADGHGNAHTIHPQRCDF